MLCRHGEIRILPANRSAATANADAALEAGRVPFTTRERWLMSRPHCQGVFPRDSAKRYKMVNSSFRFGKPNDGLPAAAS